MPLNPRLSREFVIEIVWQYGSLYLMRLKVLTCDLTSNMPRGDRASTKASLHGKCGEKLEQMDYEPGSALNLDILAFFSVFRNSKKAPVKPVVVRDAQAAGTQRR